MGGVTGSAPSKRSQQQATAPYIREKNAICCDLLLLLLLTDASCAVPWCAVDCSGDATDCAVRYGQRHDNSDGKCHVSMKNKPETVRVAKSRSNQEQQSTRGRKQSK
jgi:hypothetical protein